tara:strand:- start:183 stop:1475 length:1293 start_codon:yes stop_codon:yes gene_type:complete
MKMAKSIVSLQTVAFNQATPVTAYADAINARYNNAVSNFESLQQRIDNEIAKMPTPQARAAMRGQLKAAAKEWLRKFPKRKNWKSLDLCDAKPIAILSILIDGTTQRDLGISWCDTILRQWQDSNVRPIAIYPLSIAEMQQIPHWDGKTQLYAAWDGQHTLICLYVIAMQALELSWEDMATITVPCNIYKTSQRGQVRETFMHLNTPDGVKLLSDYDEFVQKVYGVRIDDSTKREWMDAELKQQYIEKAHLFVTSVNAPNANEIGAISRMKEIKALSPAVIRDFCIYARAVQVITPRSIDPLEIASICEWFSMVRSSKNGNNAVSYTDAQIEDLARHLYDLFGANFRLQSDTGIKTELGPFWQKVRTAYANWWMSYYGNDNDAPSKMVFKAVEKTAVVFLYHQLHKTWDADLVPALNVNTPWRPAKKDLF